MLASLLVARTLSPVLSIYWLKPPSSRSRRRESHLWIRFAQSYRDLLSWSLDHKRIVMGLALISFIGGIAIIPMIPKGFIPKLDRGEFNITYTAPLLSLPEHLRAAQEAGGREQGDKRQGAGGRGQGEI